MAAGTARNDLRCLQNGFSYVTIRSVSLAVCSLFRLRLAKEDEEPGEGGPVGERVCHAALSKVGSPGRAFGRRGSPLRHRNCPARARGADVRRGSMAQKRPTFRTPVPREEGLSFRRAELKFR